MRTRYLFIAGLGLGIAVVPAAIAESDGTVDALRAEVAELRDTVAELRNVQTQTDGDKWLTERRAAEIRALVEDVLADADSRSSLLQGSGNFSMNVGGQIQARFVAGLVDNDPTDGEDGAYGFEMRRVKLHFDGNVIDPSWTYNVQAAFGSTTGSFVLEDAYITKTFDNGFALTLGQTKAPFLAEELISSTKQLAVERSVVNEFFNQGRSQVVQLAYTQDNWRAMGAVSDGVNSANTAAITTGSGTDAFAFTARGEYIVSGTWDNFSDYTSPRGSETSVVIGGAAHWQRDKYNSAGAKDEFYTWTIDATAKFNGASLSGYVVGRHNNPGGGVSVDEFGFVVQGSYYFTDEWEGFGRYEFGDDDVNTDLSIITVGANYYLDGHNAKWTTDVGLATNSVAGAWSGAAATGWRTDSATDDGQVVFRTQLQLLF